MNKFEDILNTVLILLILVFAFETLSWADQVSGASYSVKNNVEIKSEQITLGDLIEISTPQNEWVLDEAPEAGKSITWRAQDFAKRLRPYNEQLGSAHFIIPNKIIIKRMNKIFSQAELNEKILEQLKNVAGPGFEAANSVRLVDLQQNQISKISPNSKWKVLPLRQRPKGAFQVEVVVEEAGEPLKHFWLNGHAEYHGRVGILKTDIAPREKIRSENIEWVERNLTYQTDAPLKESDFTGRVSKQALKAGTLLSTSLLEKELVLKFGEEVELKTNSDLLSITTRAISQQNGYIGDFVKVRTLGNHKVLTGKLVSKGIVQVGGAE